MPKNNCIQCDNGKYKIRGKPDSECIFKELEECQNSKAGYDKGATSVADLLFSQGVSDSYDDSDDDSLTLTNTSDDDTVGGTDVDFDEECGPQEIFSEVLQRCVINVDKTLSRCEPNMENTKEALDKGFTTYNTWSIQAQKCVEGNIGQEWNDSLQQWIWINDEFDDLPDYYPCDEINARGGCGENGRCEDGCCKCDNGYTNEDENDQSTPCVKITDENDDSGAADQNAIDPKDVNTFELEAGFKINNNIEYSIVALTISFNPSHNTSHGGGWRGHINKDLPVWRAAQVHSGAKLPETLKYNDGPLKNYAGKVPPDKYVNPILCEMFVRGKTMADEEMHNKFGTWYGKQYKDGDRRKLTHYKQGTSGGQCFPSKKTAETLGNGKRAYKSGRWGYNYKYDIDGLSQYNGWNFCAFGTSYVFDLFRMKYHNELNSGKIPGGTGLFKGSLGSHHVVKKNGIGHNGEGDSTENEGFCYFTTGAGKSLTDSDKNKMRLKRMINWKGAIFAYKKNGCRSCGHVGIVLHVEQPSTPSKSAIWTVEYNTSPAAGENGGYLAFRRRRIRSHEYWVFAGTDHLFGGSWAPKGLGDFEYLKDLLGVTGNPDFDESGELSEATLKTYFI